MSDNYQHVDTTNLGRAFPPDGRVISVDHVRYDRPHAMTGKDEEFVVTETIADQVVGAYGFTREQDAWRFVTGGENTKYENSGAAGEGVRDGLNVPDAYIVGRVTEITKENDEKLAAALRNTEEQARQIVELKAQVDSLTDLLTNPATDGKPNEATDPKATKDDAAKAPDGDGKAKDAKSGD